MQPYTVPAASLCGMKESCVPGTDKIINVLLNMALSISILSVDTFFFLPYCFT